VCHKHGYITAGDFVAGQFGNAGSHGGDVTASSRPGRTSPAARSASQVVRRARHSWTGFVADLPLLIASWDWQRSRIELKRAPASIAIVTEHLDLCHGLAAMSSFRSNWADFAKISSARVPAQKLLLAVLGEYDRCRWRLSDVELGSAFAMFILAATSYRDPERQHEPQDIRPQTRRVPGSLPSGGPY